jgi:23S rRNA U2552 (ribose-2'-O)-methylase RlmE/FtsJ
MTDGLDIDAQIRDRLDGLRRTLNDPGLSDAMKTEEVACAHARIEFLDSVRPLADGLNAVVDLAAAPGGDER